MSLLTSLPKIIEQSRIEFENAQAGDYSIIERNRYAANMLCFSDNVPFIKYLIGRGLSGKI